jgi:hypothetical protein
MEILVHLSSMTEEAKFLQRKLNSDAITKLRRIPLTLITTFSIDP